MGERGTGGGRQGALPEQRTRFFGRTGALDELVGLARHERLLSLVGPPGAGKTRLAVEVAALAAGQFAGGVRFVELAPLGAAAAIASAVGDAADVPEEPGRPMDEVLIEGLAGVEPVLIVLDNCEHVIEAAAA